MATVLVQPHLKLTHSPKYIPNLRSQYTDLLGNGVACIVWSSPLSKDSHAPLKYIDLMNSKKPHIMVSYKNNLGKEVYFEYTPSTKFYIEDKLAGRPWVTKLHFPVHCVSKTETVDKISGYRFVSSYKYHHGYFDHAEREFRGFGMVEQTDSEHFEHWIKADASNITNSELHQEPVVSKTWFHTGAFISREKILTQFANEYWYEEMKRQGFDVAHHELALPDARLIASPAIADDLINTLSAEEWREALRACKSMALRSEIFAHDAPLIGATGEQLKKQLTPYTVSTHNCVIELIQPKGNNKFAVFTVKESEAINYSYERKPEDPRIAHSINIKFDEYGNVLESVSIVYPRMIADTLLPAAVQRQQAKTIIICTQNNFTNDVISDEVYRLRLPSEVKTFELKGVTKTGNFYSLNDLKNILGASTEVVYQDINAEPPPGNPQKRLIGHVRSNYRSNDLVNALPLHQLESLAFSFESYQLAFTPGLIEDIYADKVNEDSLTNAKFIHSEGDDNWWIRSGTVQLLNESETAADAQNRFYVPLTYTDPFGSITKVEYYSNYFLFIKQTEDALENRSVVDSFNFRTLSPQRMRDANNNITVAVADELGLIKAIAVMGKGDEADDLAGLNEFTSVAENNLINELLALPETGDITDSIVVHDKAKLLLNHATVRFVYDLDVYKNAGKPAVVASIGRETHFRNTDGTIAPASKVQVGFEYSNGLGQVVMKKIQAEPGKAKKLTIDPDNNIVIDEVNTATMLRWIGNGRTILNNKGNPVKQYEPYFSVNAKYEDAKELVETGVTPIMYYDAPGRLIKTEIPGDTFSKVEFDSWKQLSYDANDTVIESKWYNDRTNNLIDESLIDEGKDPAKEKTAAQKAALHYNTPAVVHLDTLGRPFCSVAHNKRKDFTNNTIVEEFYSTLADLDTEGNLRKVTDAAGNPVMQYKYNMLGNMLYSVSMDAGERWLLNDCMGKPVYAWDSKSQQFETVYDVLHRPLTTALIKEGNTIITSRQKYFDTKDLTPAELTESREINLIGKPITQYDDAGISKLVRCDFKGNVLENTRQLCRNYKVIPDWTNVDDIELETEIFSSAAEFDAMNRPLKSFTPYTSDIPASVIIPKFNEANFLNAVDAKIRSDETETGFVVDINYDAKGQRESIQYANNTVTRYTYDKKTFRLIRLHTTKRNDDGLIEDLQDIYYTYDAVGNIYFIRDAAQKTVFFNGQEVKPENAYDYDAIYQLIQAAGREHAGQNKANETGTHNNIRNFPFENELSAADVNALRNYIQQYVYDPVGNILQMRHIIPGDTINRWTRRYWYNNNDSARDELGIDPDTIKNNQLLQTQIGAATLVRYHHDIQGNMLNLPHLQQMIWNYKDQLRQIDLGGGGNVFYVYDGGGQRIRKIIERLDGSKNERLYLGTVEIYRETNSAGIITKQTDSLHIMDDTRRIALTDTPVVIPNGSEETQVIRFIYSNHLGSSSLELNERAVTISYEEYHPYGTTSFSAANADIKSAAKRYRYTGMERDEESGMAYHSARYYLNWLGRWLSADPISIEGGMNLYRYCHNCILNNNDTTGLDDDIHYVDRKEQSNGIKHIDNIGGFTFQEKGGGTYYYSPGASRPTHIWSPSLGKWRFLDASFNTNDACTTENNCIEDFESRFKGRGAFEGEFTPTEFEQRIAGDNSAEYYPILNEDNTGVGALVGWRYSPFSDMGRYYEAVDRDGNPIPDIKTEYIPGTETMELGFWAEMANPINWGPGLIAGFFKNAGRRVASRFFSGSTDDGAAAIGGSIDEVAASSKIVPGGGLAGHEGPTLGHTLARHVGKTDADLAARLAANPGLTDTSAFLSREVAESSISNAIDSNASIISKWLSTTNPGPNVKLPLNYMDNEIVGRTLLRGASGAIPTPHLGVILIRDSSSLGYHIRTAFPTLKQVR